ncbi:adenosine deaminase [Paenibacillus sp. JX-17]|uniref:adenosine deaminase n=1 Tax=Paenibacillus lacisoli TaxID=3064525 RepID=A0ABT9CJA8_9BACL|nr:adenosine deaminase [Paenibacillus sp. JX-17]MDO7908618.1 adenosine deaminase [Paenibacillus sp. JX-17]
MLQDKQKEILRKMPKLDLHLHLDGSVKTATILDLARQRGIKLPAVDADGLIPHMKVSGRCGSLVEYLSKFDFVAGFLHTGEALERVAFELVEQAAADNCEYIEVRFGPQLHRGEGLSCYDAIGHVLQGLQRGEQVYGVTSRAIAICLRHHSIRDNLEVIEAAAAYKGKGLAAVDLAGPEAEYPAELHREVFERAQALGLAVTIHAGEAAGPENIREAITRLGATRIGHGVRLREDKQVFHMVHDQGIVLEMCPISNYQTRAVADWNVYPIREYFDAGLKLTVNTDNLTVSNTSIHEEYSILMDKFGFRLKEIGQLILNGVDAAFLEPAVKRRMKERFESRFAQLGALQV